MDKIFIFLDLLNRSLKFLEGFKLPRSFCKKNNNIKQIVKKIIKVKIENLNPIVSTRIPPIKKPNPFVVFFNPVNHETHLNKTPSPFPETIFIADFEDVFVISFAIPHNPCANIIQITERYRSHEGE